MNSSDDDNDFEDDGLCKYGNALPQYEADEIPSKKPIQIEDMVVKDENGRRRFHGAFTGGFSAGYWNTVGSKEGFTPQEFKSSRSEKASLKTFKPSDFMDDEDLGEFGILPQKIQTKEDFETSSSGAAKRKREKPSEGPIPGEPVLSNLLKPTRDRAAVRILKSMGWRDHQGIGSRMTYKEKKRAQERNKREMYMQNDESVAHGSEEEFSDEEITFAPDDFDPYIMNVKDNTFGLGYSGLKPSLVSTQKGHVNFFKTFVDRNDKKFTIGGSAFGVGALEKDDDDDIYALDDMSNYDRTLGGEIEKNKKKVPKILDASLLEGFAKTTINDSQVRVYSVDIPRNFKPRNWHQRKSRFDPLEKAKAEEIEAQNRYRKLGLGRHDLKPEERGSLINDKSEEPKKKEESTTVKIDAAAKKISELLNSKQFVSENNQTFKPFISNLEKQERYEKFLALKTSDEKEIEKLLNDIQPLNFSSFEREMEKKEFMQAKRMYQPLDFLMANRFVKEVDAIKENEVKKKIENGKEIVVIQRATSMWKPHKNLCKRFNVPEPYGGKMFDEEEEKKRKKQSSSLFDYIGVPLNSKSNFVTPQVIPRKLTEDNRQKNEDSERRKNFLAAVEKEKHFMDATRATAKDFFDESSKIKKIEPIIRKEPESELEKKAIESIDKKPEEKKDLFRAIFCDSEDENDEEEQPPAANSNELSEQQKSKFIESFLITKPASEINVLRNASPPRGIFKGIFELASTSRKIEESKADNEEILYGPKLPATPLITPIVPISSESSSSDESDLDQILLKKLKKVKKDKSVEKWVEKDKVKKSKKEKKSKKKKAHKKEHKKHKSKK